MVSDEDEEPAMRGGYGRFAAQSISMFPTHSGGPWRQDTAEESFEALQVQKRWVNIYVAG